MKWKVVLLALTVNISQIASQNTTVAPTTVVSTIDISEREKQAAMKKFFSALDSMTGGSLGEFPGGSTFYSFNKAIYSTLSQKPATLWDKIRAHVQQTVDKTISDININDIDSQLAILERGLKEEEDPDDLYDKVRDLMQIVFPQHSESVSWSKELVLRPALFVPLVIQTYQLNMDKRKIEKCRLAERLSEIRENIILGMKEMIRKKYRQIKAKSHSSENVTSVTYSAGSFTEDIRAAILSEGLQTETINVSFKSTDKPEKYFPVEYHTFKFQIDKIKNNVINFLMSAVVNNVNNFFQKEICMMCSQCPSSITREDINLDWPSDCYDEDNNCQHPCGDFSQNDTPWCWLKGYYRDNEKYDKCYPIDIRCCINLPFDHNPGRCEKAKETEWKKKLQS